MASSPEEVLAETIERALEPYRRLLTPAQLESFRALLAEELAADPSAMQLANTAHQRFVFESGDVRRDGNDAPLPAEGTTTKRKPGR